MKIVFLSGGLGNQMFQYAFYKQLSERCDDVKCDWGLLKNRNIHNGYELSRIFNINDVECNPFSRFFARVLYYLRILNKRRVLSIVRGVFNCDVIMDKEDLFVNNHRNLFILGYWQAERFLSQNFEFEFNDSLLNTRTKEIYRAIESCNSISIHIRRGDYLTKGNIGIYGNISTIEYYKNAISKIREYVQNPKFYIFSNDVEWVKENIPLADAEYVSHNIGEESWQDMFLMSKCKHNIIANSTFSWWGAWLNKNDGKIVICPNKFTNTREKTEIYPQNWIRVLSI